MIMRAETLAADKIAVRGPGSLSAQNAASR
jgi:hypothetical protein